MPPQENPTQALVAGIQRLIQNHETITGTRIKRIDIDWLKAGEWDGYNRQKKIMGFITLESE